MIFSFRSHSGRILVSLLSGGLLALAAVPIAPANASVMTGVTAYWNFNESSGTTAANSGSAGASLDGTLLGATAFVEGLFGNALSLPGTDADYVNVANRVIADGQAAYTISVWFNPDDVKTTGGRRQVLFESAPKYALSAGFAGTSNVVEHYVETTAGIGRSTTFRPTQGQWHHLAITYAYDSGANQGTSKIYVDGIEFPAAQITSSGALAATASFRIGRHRVTNGFSFDGLLDDMAIWDRTLTGHEASAIYRMGQAGLALSSDIAVQVKANNTDNLNLAASWESGGAPGASSYLAFDATFAQTGALNTGSALAVAGLRVTGGTTLINVANPAANYLELGALGVDMTSAQRNLTVANLRLGADQAWDIGTGRTLSVGSLSGAHAFTKNGPGTVAITGAGTHTGGATLTAGTLQVGHNTALGTGAVTLNGGTLSSNSTTARTLANDVNIGGNVTLGHATNSGALTFTGPVDLGGAARQFSVLTPYFAFCTFSGAIDNGGLIKAGAGTLTLSGANTYAGGTTLAAGMLRVGNDSALGTGTLTLGGGVLSPVGAAARTLQNNVAFSGNVTIGNHLSYPTDSGSMIFAGQVDLGGAARQITNHSDVAFSGDIKNGGLAKAGAGTLSLSGANTYAGGTTVTGGTVAALSDGALGTGDVTLAGGALHVERSFELANDVVLNASAGQNFIRGVVAADYLVVGGGGGGAGRDSSGGGGGGGVLSNLATPGMDVMQVVGSGEFAVIVGAGGEGAVGPDGSGTTRGQQGQSSSLGDIAALGGGGGGGYATTGGTGASGGGGGRNFAGGVGTEGQGFAGGAGSGSNGTGGGGGGAGEVGQTGVLNVKGGDGGDGVASTIISSSLATALNVGEVYEGQVYFGGGGGGTPHRGTTALASGAGGLGGGGGGAVTNAVAPATVAPNTGGGGGASRSDQPGRNSGAAGGSGIVIVRYLGDTAATGGTISAGTGSADGYTLHTFTDVGSGTLEFGPINATISGAMSGSGGFTWDTPGTLTLGNANTHVGDTRVTAGAVALANTHALRNSTLTLAGGTAAFTAPSATSYTLGGLAGTSALDAGSNTLIVGGNNRSTAYAGNLTAAQLTKSGSGSLTLSGANTLGGTKVSGGALVAASEGALGAGAVTLDGGTLHVERNVVFSNQIVLDGTAEENVIRGAVAVDYLVVGGGGGGAGRDVNGGGGGGGVVSNLATPGMAPVGLATGTYDVTVGDGGAGGVNVVRGENGEASSFDFIVALGGGAGGPFNSPAGSGASGGGAGRESTPGTGIDGQGFAGGVGGGLAGSGGGGGGAGAPGSDGGLASGQPAGSGGDGLAVNITGAVETPYYGGGGGGNVSRALLDNTVHPAGLGGRGGGGDGATGYLVIPDPGAPNTGGGGGASRSAPDWAPPGQTTQADPVHYTGGKGGSGIVVVRYLGDQVAEGGTVTAGTGSAAGYTVHTFTDVGAHSLEFGAINATISGSMTGSGGFTWDTPGTLTLTGTSDYTGTTRITAGTLALAGTGSIAGSATINVHSGATFDLTGTTGTYELHSGQTLKGEGTVRGGLVMNPDSWLAPGASPGILTQDGDLTLNGAGLLVDIWSDDGPGTGHDLLEFISGTLTLTGDPQIRVNLDGFNPELGSSYTIISGFENELTDGFDPNVLVQNAGVPFSYEFFQINYYPGSIALTLIPEPGTLVMLVMALLGLLAFGRRRR